MLSFVGGFIIDRWLGVQKATLLFSGLIAAGQLLFACGIQFKSYPVCLLGRFIFGLGGENLTVSQVCSTICTHDLHVIPTIIPCRMHTRCGGLTGPSSPSPLPLSSASLVWAAASTLLSLPCWPIRVSLFPSGLERQCA